MLEENKQLVQRYYDELWNRWEYALVDEMLSAAFEFRGSIGRTTHGREGFKEYHKRLLETERILDNR